MNRTCNGINFNVYFAVLYFKKHFLIIYIELPNINIINIIPIMIMYSKLD